MIRRCCDCGTPFEAKSHWIRRCWKCWRKEKDRQLALDSYDPGYAGGLAVGYRKGRRRSTVTCCGPGAAGHPDRNPTERVEMANRATLTLIGLSEPHRTAGGPRHTTNKTHFGVCHLHRSIWCVGSNLFDLWRRELKDAGGNWDLMLTRQDERWREVADYKPVDDE
jgi:hypothetical protein